MIGVKLEISELQVSKEELNSAKIIDEAFKEALQVAIKNITVFHQKQSRTPVCYQGKYGETLMQRMTPMDRAGVYIPGGVGGHTPLISSALMNIIPAQIAGVQEIVAVTPPQPNKRINPYLLYLFRELQVDKIFKIGGAQAIAALAYGTDHVPACDIVVGPGNTFVSLAKKIVFGEVMIDGVFGPSEIVIVSDGCGHPAHIAADLISQAEHAGDELSLLITDSRDHAEKSDQRNRKSFRKTQSPGSHRKFLEEKRGCADSSRIRESP